MSAYAIHHASLVVRDLAVARPFYEDILGLAISPMRPDKPFPGVWYQVGEQQIHLLICPEALQAEIRDVYPGMQRHVALRVRDLDDAEATLRRFRAKKYLIDADPGWHDAGEPSCGVAGSIAD